jgi:hypothetical protein
MPPRRKPTERGNPISRAVKAVQSQAMKMVGSQSPRKVRVYIFFQPSIRWWNSFNSRTLNRAQWNLKRDDGYETTVRDAKFLSPFSLRKNTLTYFFHSMRFRTNTY